MRGQPRVARRLLREQPAGRERPAHEPGARDLVGVLADEQRAGGHVDRGVGEAQPLLDRPVPAGLGEGGAAEAREVEHPQPARGVGDVEQVLAPREPARVGLDRLAVLGDERDVAVAPGGGVDHRQPRGAVALGVPGHEQEVAAPVDPLRIPVLRRAVLRGPTGSRRSAPVRAAPPAARRRARTGPAAGRARRRPARSRAARRSARGGARTAPGRSGAGRWRAECSRRLACRTVATRADLPIRRNTFLLSASLAANSGTLQLSAAVASLTLVSVVGVKGLLGLGPAIVLASWRARRAAGRARDGPHRPCAGARLRLPGRHERLRSRRARQRRRLRARRCCSASWASAPRAAPRCWRALPRATCTRPSIARTGSRSCCSARCSAPSSVRSCSARCCTGASSTATRSRCCGWRPAASCSSRW